MNRTTAHRASWVPFFDLSRLQERVAEEVERAWAMVRSDGTFVGGAHVERFEVEWAEYCSTRHAVGVANGTDALQLALQALGIGPGDEVLVPANTFVATAEAVLLAGATPCFVDVDASTQLVSQEILESAVTPATAAIIVVHLYGNVPDMDAICSFASRAGVALVEDAAQAHAADWRGEKAGSFGHAGCFSFYPSKNLGAFGDAGAVVTNDRWLAERIRSLGNHGRSATSDCVHPLAGTNSRLDGLQAAVLSAKLPFLEQWNEARRTAAERYRGLMGGCSIRFVDPPKGARSARHLNVCCVRSRDTVRSLLRRRGIETRIHYPTPCHRQEAYEPYANGALPVSEQSAREVLSLPLFPHITLEEIARVCEALREALAEVPFHDA